MSSSAVSNLRSSLPLPCSSCSMRRSLASLSGLRPGFFAFQTRVPFVLQTGHARWQAGSCTGAPGATVPKARCVQCRYRPPPGCLACLSAEKQPAVVFGIGQLQCGSRVRQVWHGIFRSAPQC
jgi:hypothetical protein